MLSRWFVVVGKLNVEQVAGRDGKLKMTSAEIPEPTVRVVRVEVSCVPGDFHFTIYVEFRGHRDGADWYSVTDGFNPSDTLDRNGKWCLEAKPWSRSPSWRKARQFTLDEAIEIAKRYAPNVTVNGFTVEDGLRMKAKRDARDA
jgi:hypothetical protein